jgi:hypothetical protein
MATTGDDMGEAADKQLAGYVGAAMLAVLALIGAIMVVVGVNGVVDESRSAGVFPARVVATPGYPDYVVTFRGPKGAEKLTLEKATRLRHEVGDTINIRYWPETGRIEPSTKSAPLFLAFGILLAVIGLAGTSYHLVRGWRRRRR